MIKSVVGVSVVALAAMSSQAALLQFFGEDLNPGFNVANMTNANNARAAFLSNLVGVGTEDFESFGVGQNATGAVLNFGAAGTATLNGGGGSAVFFNNAVGNPVGRFATSGDRYLDTQAGPGGGFNIAFSAPVAAFGFYGTDIGDFTGQLSLTLSGGGVVMLNVPHTLGGGGSSNGSGLYFGVIGTTAGDTFTSVQFTASNGTDFFGFDDMTIGSLQQVSVIPLPTAGAMGLAGLGVLGVRRRRVA